MNICPNCGYNNRVGMLFCEECGHSLSGDPSNATLPTKQIQQVTNELSAKTIWGAARFEQNAEVVIHIRDASEPIVLQPKSSTILLGRTDPSSTQEPDLDLTPFGALEKGVSRIHAAIERSEDTLTIHDLGSSNGTHLNGQRLAPDQPRVLRDGDEIRLGKLVAHIYFK